MFCTVSISKFNQGRRQVLLLGTDSLLIDGNVKVGILGRTGSGKSTLALGRTVRRNAKAQAFQG